MNTIQMFHSIFSKLSIDTSIKKQLSMHVLSGHGASGPDLLFLYCQYASLQWKSYSIDQPECHGHWTERNEWLTPPISWIPISKLVSLCIKKLIDNWHPISAGKGFQINRCGRHRRYLCRHHKVGVEIFLSSAPKSGRCRWRIPVIVPAPLKISRHQF